MAGLCCMAIWIGCGEAATEDRGEADVALENAAPEPEAIFVEEDVSADLGEVEKAELGATLRYCIASSEERLVMDRQIRSMRPDSKGILVPGLNVLSNITKPLFEDNIFGEHWVFFLCDIKQHITIEMKSYVIDPQVVVMKGLVEGHTEFIAENDDSDESLNAKVSLQLPLGAYQLVALANPEVRGVTGQYTISLTIR